MPTAFPSLSLRPITLVALAVAICSCRAPQPTEPPPPPPIAASRLALEAPPIAIDLLNLPDRPGRRPDVSDAPVGTNYAHRQLSDGGPPHLRELLLERAATLPRVNIAESLVSVPGAAGLFLDESVQGANEHAFMAGREFAHIHPADDGSLHLMLPDDIAREVVSSAWGEPHPRSPRALMIYAPRDEQEADLITHLIVASYLYALGM